MSNFDDVVDPESAVGAEEQFELELVTSSETEHRNKPTDAPPTCSAASAGEETANADSTADASRHRVRAPALYYPPGYGRIGKYDDELPEGPIKEPRKAYISRVGRFYSFKDGRLVGRESGHEEKFMRVLLLNPRVRSISREARPFIGSDGKRRRSYRPDVRADLHDGSTVRFEVKPDKFQIRPKIAADLKAIGRLMTRLGHEWQVVPQKVYDDPVLQRNARELNSCGRLSYTSPEALAVARDEIAGTGSTTPRRLAASAGFELCVARWHLFHLVAWGHATLDMSEPLGPDTEVRRV